MDKTEYQLKLNELTECVQNREYQAALKIVGEIDWNRVKSIRTLSMVADIYEVNRDYRNCKRILLLAYEKTTIGKNLLFRLTEISLKLKEMEDAEKYYEQYLQVAPNDNARHLLKYKLLKAKDAPIEERIRLLETYKDYEYTERWAYELAELYHKAGMEKECIDACDDMILWFSEGRYVLKAMELKKKHESLAPYQQRLYEKVVADKPEAETPNIILPVATKAAVEATFAKSSHVDSKIVLQKMDQAGAAITKDVTVDNREQAMPLTDAAIDRYSVTSKEFIGKTANLSLELEKSIQNVFANQEKEVVPHFAEPFVPEETAVEPVAPEDDLSEKITAALFEEETPAEEPAAEAVEEAAEEAAAEEAVAEAEPVEEAAVEAAAEEAVVEAEAAETVEAPVEEAVVEAEAVEEAAETVEAAAEEAVAEAAPVEETAETVEASVEEAVVEAEPVEETAETVEASVEEAVVEAEPVEETAEAVEASVEEAVVEAEPVEETAEAVETPVVEAVAEAEPVEEVAAEAPVEETPAEVLIDSEEEPAATGAAGLLIEDLFDILEVPTETAMEETAEEAVEAPVEEAVVEAPVEEAVAEAPVAEVAEVAVETIEAVAETAAAVTEAAIPEVTEAAPEIKPERLAMYNLDLEIPDPEPTEEEKKSHTIPLSKLGQNTVPISIEDVLRQETPEERRIRILNDAKPTRMNDDQRKIFTYFARIPGMDRQILTALSGVYKYAGEHTSNRGNIAVMGARGTGKTRLTQGLLANMCKDMGLEAAKVARVTGEFLNSRDMAKVVQKMSGGFLVIEDAGEMSEETIENLNKAMEFRTDCMIVILEAAKAEMRALLKNHPVFAEKFNTVINIPAFTNDELVTFARTYCSENNCQMDELGVLALYTLISNNQSEEEPVTIADVKKMVDGAISHAQSGGKRFGRGRRSKGKMTILYEKDFNLL